MFEARLDGRNGHAASARAQQFLIFDAGRDLAIAKKYGSRVPLERRQSKNVHVDFQFKKRA
jgi:hypothetical protein